MAGKKFKITVQQVRDAARKNGLEIESGSYFSDKINCKDYSCKLSGACPIGQLYYLETKSKDPFKAVKFGEKKLGKHYRDGLVAGFDEYSAEDIAGCLVEINRKRDRDNFKLGLQNGKHLRRYLLKSDNNTINSYITT